MLVVTMTTLGFGDVVPKALLARAFVGFASVLGIFLMALFISVVHEALQLKQQEKRILATMENAGKLLISTRPSFTYLAYIQPFLFFANFIYLYNWSTIELQIQTN